MQQHLEKNRIVFLSFVLLPFVGRFIAHLFPVYPDA